jgi:hypothetical protein
LSGGSICPAEVFVHVYAGDGFRRFVQSNIDKGRFESYRGKGTVTCTERNHFTIPYIVVAGEDVVSFKRFVARQDKSEGFELSKFLDAQEIAWKQVLDPLLRLPYSYSLLYPVRERPCEDDEGVE